MSKLPGFFKKVTHIRHKATPNPTENAVPQEFQNPAVDSVPEIPGPSVPPSPHPKSSKKPFCDL